MVMQHKGLLMVCSLRFGGNQALLTINLSLDLQRESRAYLHSLHHKSTLQRPQRINISENIN